MMNLEKHHIVYKSQGGMDFSLNYRYLSAEEHRGNNGPHMNRKTDLRYKEQMELDLRALLVGSHYKENDLIQMLGLQKKQAEKAFKRLLKTSEGICKEDIIFRLMGGRFYI